MVRDEMSIEIFDILSRMTNDEIGRFIAALEELNDPAYIRFTTGMREMYGYPELIQVQHT